jgi:hypothetical protein
VYSFDTEKSEEKVKDEHARFTAALAYVISVRPERIPATHGARPSQYSQTVQS